MSRIIKIAKIALVSLLVLAAVSCAIVPEVPAVSNEPVETADIAESSEPEVTLVPLETSVPEESEVPETSVLPEESAAETAEVTEPDESVLPSLTSDPIKTFTAEETATMLPVFDSLIRTANENSLEYSSEDADFVWGYLFRIASNWGYIIPGIGFEEGVITVPENVMQGFFRSAFSEQAVLPEIPEGMGIYFDGQSYTLIVSDLDTSYTEINTYSVKDDGTVAVHVYFCSKEDEILNIFDFVIKNNPYQADYFKYCITSMEEDI